MGSGVEIGTGVGEWIVGITVLLLALYGCAHVIRRVCLMLTRCPRTVRSYRLVVPQEGTAMEPLFRCLQAQSVWEENGLNKTVILLPPISEEEKKLVERLTEENPAILPVSREELSVLIAALT